MRYCACIAVGTFAGVLIDILAAYIYLGCMDRDWP